MLALTFQAAANPCTPCMQRDAWVGFAKHLVGSPSAGPECHPTGVSSGQWMSPAGARAALPHLYRAAAKAIWCPVAATGSSRSGP